MLLIMLLCTTNTDININNSHHNMTVNGNINTIINIQYDTNVADADMNNHTNHAAATHITY